MLEHPIHLFLDFDGVLHPSIADHDELFEHANRVGEVVRDFPRVRVVISSTWRELHDLSQLQALCGSLPGSRIVGVTPRLRVAPRPGLVRPSPWHERFEEIALWMAAHAPCGHERLDPAIDGAAASQRNYWIALDDCATFFPPACRQLMLIADSGFQESDVNRLQTRLANLSKIGDSFNAR